ncbi:MAG: RimK-like ATPgrasp N-terminal domain-containing protein, partial [Hyphomicrobiales bacterium]|nr:RimK-like ATPgrasp N-terminal domain-containing protein [Hyphomicrobiales bacterium]
MPGWVVIVDFPKDFPNADTPHKVITTKEYLARPQLFRSDRPKIINLSRSYAYQSRGYYASLLAEARGHRVVPAVETILELSTTGLYQHALPELEDILNRNSRKAGGDAPKRLLVCFGAVADPNYERFGRYLFDWFRCPAIEVTIKPGEWNVIDRLRAVPATKITAEDTPFFHQALHDYTRREWRRPRTKEPARYTFAALHDPNEALPPTSVPSLKHWARIAEKLSVEVEPITKRDLARLAEFDALFIRETTSIDNHTFRFARRAQQEGMPVID